MITGALCGIPLAIFIPILFVIRMLVSESNLLNLLSNLERLGTVGGLLVLYILIMLINIVQQSLKSSGTKDNLAFYLSPASILFALYLTYQVVTSFF